MFPVSETYELDQKCHTGGSMQRSPRGGNHVERHVWITGLKWNKANYYRKLHGRPWPGVKRMIKNCHIQNFSIHERKIAGKLYLIAYLEYTGREFDADMKKMAADAETQRWWRETDPCQRPLPDAAAKGKIWADAKEIFYLP